MSGSERRKGSAGELEVARLFQAAGFDCDRTPNSGGLRIRGDLHGDLPLHVEVKRQETARPWLWASQARADAGDSERWVVAMRRSRDEWVAMLPLVDLVRLLATEREVASSGAAQASAQAPRFQCRTSPGCNLDRVHVHHTDGGVIYVLNEEAADSYVAQRAEVDRLMATVKARR